MPQTYRILIQEKQKNGRYDEGHIKDKSTEHRSFEAMTAVVYRPDAVQKKENKARKWITSKHCAASALDDQQAQMKQLTLLAAQKEGLSKNIKLTALCNGADNRWNIID